VVALNGRKGPLVGVSVAAGGGGTYWSEFDHSFKDSAGALQGARGSLMIFKATGEQEYFDHAHRLYTWAQHTTQQPSGLFMEKLYLTGPNAGQVGDWELVNFAGFGISANVLFYEVTGDDAHLQEAQRIAAASVARFTDPNGAIRDEGYWAYELTDALVNLYRQDHDPQWLGAVRDGLTWLHDNKRDPNGRYGKFWGRQGPQTTPLDSWNLNDMAPVARAYLQLGLVDRVMHSQVVGRHLFYNSSVFDGYAPEADSRDDDAIAPDKAALMPGETAGFAHYTSYAAGPNGVMVDVAGLPIGATLDANDFEFRVGNDNDPSGWAVAPTPGAITVRPTDGLGGSARVTITWNDYAITGQWLQITVLDTQDTDLPVPEVFYFGNAVGETGDAPADARVNAADVLLTRNNPRTFLTPAPIDFPCDFNRDGRVNATDLLIARINQTHLLDALKLIAVPGEEPAAYTSPEELAWLHAFSEMEADESSAQKAATAEDAVDAWLASYEA